MDVLEVIQKLTFDKNVEEDKTTEDNNEILINYVMTGKKDEIKLRQLLTTILHIILLLILYMKTRFMNQNLLKNVDIEKIDFCGKKQLRHN